jgi:Secretion system C-terminal sorting domain
MGKDNLRQTVDGGFILSIDSEERMDSITHLTWLYLIKSSPNGTTQWVKRFPKSNFAAAHFDANSIDLTHDKGFILGTARAMYDSTLGQYTDLAMLVRTDSIGNIQWAAEYPGLYTSRCWSVHETSDYGFIACGQTSDSSTLVNNCFLIRTDALGNVLWAKGYEEQNTGSGNCFFAVQETSDGGFITCGQYGTSSSSGIVTRLDGNGNVLWSRDLPGADLGSVFIDLAEVENGNYIVTGWARKYNPNGNLYGSCMIKFDDNGNTIWSYDYTSYSSYPILETSYSVVYDSKGYHFMGTHDEYYSQFSAITQTYMATLDTAGTVLWARSYDYPQVYHPEYNKLIKTNDKGFAFTTMYYDNITTVPYWGVAEIRTDSNGVVFSCPDSLMSLIQTSIPALDSITVLSDATNDFYFINLVSNPYLVHDSLYCGPPNPDAVLEVQETNGLLLYPNPSSGNCYLQLNVSVLSPIQIQVYDARGRLVLQQNENAGTLNIELRTGSFADGIYLVKVFGENEIVWTTKFVKSE